MSRQRMHALIEKYSMLNRIPVGDDTSRFVRELADDLGVPVWSIPSGTKCLTWAIPPKWTVHDAYLESAPGHRLADFRDHPLYLKSYSAPFTGRVSREELLQHVFTDPDRPDRILYDCRAQYAFGQRTDWGFSLPYRLVESLTEDEYDVHIDVSFDDGEMDLIDCTLPGDSSDTIFIAAHTCHPAQVNDGIACVAVAVELFRRFAERSERRYTYRLILGPEYYAAAAVLAHGQGIDQLKAGFFLDMLGNGQPIGFSRSFQGNTYVDRVTRNVMSHRCPDHFERPYRGLWGNDEMFYDGPDFTIPTIGLGRDVFDNYHTDADNLANCDFDQLEQTLDLLEAVIKVFETDGICRRNYRGPLYQSRYDLYIDPKIDPKGYENLQACQILMDGQRSCTDIASQLQIDFGFVRSFADELCKRNLATLQPPPTPFA